MFITLAAVVGATLPRRTDANYDCATGRIIGVTGDSITVYDKETRTFTVDSRTRFTAWPTQGRWQEIRPLETRELFCQSRVLDIGRLVAVHPRHDGTSVARWVQVAIDERADNGLAVNACLR
jgi:hypothetical protein